MRILVDEGPGPRARAASPSGSSSTARPPACWRWPARVATRGPAWCTPAAPPPAPRWSGRSSTPPTARPAPCSRDGSPSICWSRAAAAPACWPCRRAACGGPGRGAGGPRRAGHRRRRPALLGHHQPGRVHGRRRGHGAAGRRPDGRRRVRAVPPHRAAPPGHAPPAALRGAARPRRAPARPGRRALRRRAGAPRRGEPGHGGPHGRAGRRPPVAGRHGARALLGALPDHCGVALLHRARSPARLVADRAGGPPPVGRRGDRPVGRHGAARAVGGGRGGVHRGARGQPAGLQFAARGHGVRGPPGRAHPVGRAVSPEPSGALRAVLGDEPIDGIGCTVLEDGGHAGRRRTRTGGRAWT